MAIHSIAIPPDARRDAKARELAKRAHLWPTATLKVACGAFEAGDRFRLTPNGYLVNAVACQCPDYQQSGNICKHVRAMVLMEQRQARPTYEEIFKVCVARNCDEDRLRHEKFCRRHVLVDAF